MSHDDITRRLSLKARCVSSRTMTCSRQCSAALRARIRLLTARATDLNDRRGASLEADGDLERGWPMSASIRRVACSLHSISGVYFPVHSSAHLKLIPPTMSSIYVFCRDKPSRNVFSRTYFALRYRICAPSSFACVLKCSF